MTAFFAFLAFVLYFMVRMLQSRAPRREEQKVRQSLAQALKSRRTANLPALAKLYGVGLGTLLEGVEPRGGRYHFKSGNRDSLFWTTFLLSRTVDGPIIKGNVPIVNRQAMSDRENWKTRERKTMDIKITRTTSPRPKPADPTKLGFGTVFTDHMFTMDYDTERGWHDAEIVPLDDLRIHPGAAVFHYGAEVFEGLKAYRTEDGSVQLFRPMDNMQRMRDSAERIQLPDFDPDFLLSALLQLVALDQEWTPAVPSASLYIRPFEICTDIDLGLHSIGKAKMLIILSPVGSYLSGGLRPVSILIEDQDVRAVRGGTGYAKCGGNYAAANRAAARAEKKGYSQVLWLDGVHRKYIEEVGGMNVMFKIGGKVVTPALTGSVLPGITRRSCIQLLRDKGLEVEERLISVDEVMDALSSGAMEEAWGCGTAAVISPIGSFAYQDKAFTVNGEQIGPCAQELYDTLTGIQWGRREDPYGWTVKVPKN